MRGPWFRTLPGSIMSRARDQLSRAGQPTGRNHYASAPDGVLARSRLSMQARIRRAGAGPAPPAQPTGNAASRSASSASTVPTMPASTGYPTSWLWFRPSTSSPRSSMRPRLGSDRRGQCPVRRLCDGRQSRSRRCRSSGGPATRCRSTCSVMSSKVLQTCWQRRAALWSGDTASTTTNPNTEWPSPVSSTPMMSSPMREGSAGDVLVLTKPIGTGVIATAIKRGTVPAEIRDGAVASMIQLNGPASRAMRTRRRQSRNRHHRVRPARTPQ